MTIWRDEYILVDPSVSLDCAINCIHYFRDAMFARPIRKVEGGGGRLLNDCRVIRRVGASIVRQTDDGFEEFKPSVNDMCGQWFQVIEPEQDIEYWKRRALAAEAKVKGRSG